MAETTIAAASSSSKGQQNFQNLTGDDVSWGQKIWINSGRLDAHWGYAGEARGAQLAALAEADRDTSPQTSLFYQQAVSAVPVLLIGFVFREGNTLVSKLSVQTLTQVAGSSQEHQACFCQGAKLNAAAVAAM